MEAWLAALEADAWASSPATALDGRQYHAMADAAVQTAFGTEPVVDAEPDVPADIVVPPILVASPSAARVGTAGRYACTHLDVPTRFQTRGAAPKTCWGWPFGSDTWTSVADIGIGEACEKCLPGLATRIRARCVLLAADVVETIEEPEERQQGARSRSSRRRTDVCAIIVLQA